MTLEHGHVAELAIGGKARRSANLRALPPEPASFPEGWEPLDGVPPCVEGECTNVVRPCPYVRCAEHLWMVDARDRPGRRHVDGSGPASDLSPATMTTCTRDVIEYALRVRGIVRGRLLTNAEVGELLGVSDERVRQLAERAMAKYTAHRVELGVDVERRRLPAPRAANDVTEQELDELIAAFEAA